METIKHMSKIKQHRIAVETRDVYVPLAHRLGMSSLKSQLEDLVFHVLDPSGYKKLDSQIKSSKMATKKITKTPKNDCTKVCLSSFNRDRR